MAENFPGCLSHQTLAQIKSALLQEAGVEPRSERNADSPHVCRRDPSRRVSHAVDVMTQRIKAGEATVQGTHWNVSQRIELIPQEMQSLAGSMEVKEAQRDAYTEQKTRWLASLQGDRNQGGGKGGKSKGQGKEIRETAKARAARRTMGRK